MKNNTTEQINENIEVRKSTKSCEINKKAV